jgi:hypothetical protein
MGQPPFVARSMMQLAIAPLLLLIATPPAPPSPVILLLRDGSRIETAGRIERQGGSITFRNRAGVLYSIPASEVEREISGEEAGATQGTVLAVVPAAPMPRIEKPRLTDIAGRKLNDKERLLHAIEQNHSGVAAPPAAPEEIAPPPEPAAATLRNPDEWAWRRDARFHQETVRRAEEDLAQLQARERRLEDEILSLTALGYHARQFTYQTSELVRVREALGPAALELARARRALEQFMDDARRQDILPGWLR